MSEEEKETIEDCKELVQELKQHKDKDFIGRLYYRNKPVEDILSVLLNLIENQQKEINNIKEIEKSHKEENGKLRVELEQEKEKNKELEAKRIWNKLRIEGLKKELVQEKEKNKELENELDKTTYLLSRCNKRLENIARELIAEIKSDYYYKEIMQEIKNIKENECTATKCQMIKENYISKDKIKEKIRQLEDKIHVVIPNEYNQIEVINEFKNEGAINILKELLEEK